MNEHTKILVVDDNEVVRHSFLRSLTGAHCKVEAAWNGEQALRAMEQQPYDVVLLDLRMPGMNGMEVLRAIKKKWALHRDRAGQDSAKEGPRESVARAACWASDFERTESGRMA